VSGRRRAGGAAPAPVRVRAAAAADGPAARGLLRENDELHAALAPGYFRAAGRDESEGAWRRLLDEPNGAVLVAATGAGGAVVGLVIVRVYDTPPDPTMVPRRRAHVDTLVVAAAERRRGVGRRLMDEAGVWARARGAEELVLTTWAGNEAAEAFYRRLGYAPRSTAWTRALP
jgi:ribosomal protein S18 acetylase RimI-like enzyme